MPTELKTAAPRTTPIRQTGDLDPNALNAIRDIMTAETEIEPPRPVAERAIRAAQAAGAAGPAPAAAAPRQSASLQPDPTAAEPAQAATAPKARRAGPLARLRGYRPTPKHIMLGLLAVVILFRPWLLVSVVLLTVAAVAAAFLIVGSDGVWTKSMSVARWYAQRNPERAAEMHRRLDAFASRWDAILDRFPEGSVDWLYLPDFGELASADDRHADALARRLAEMEQLGA